MWANDDLPVDAVPFGLEATIAVKDLDPQVLAVSDVHPTVGVASDVVRQVELARLGARPPPRRQQGAIG